MTIGIIDVPQQINIRHNDSKRAVKAIGAFQFGRQGFGKIFGVVKTGFGFNACLLLQGWDLQGCINHSIVVNLSFAGIDVKVIME